MRGRFPELFSSLSGFLVWEMPVVYTIRVASGWAGRMTLYYLSISSRKRSG